MARDGRTRKKGRISKVGACIRRAAATTTLKRKQMIDSAHFKKEDLTPEMSGKFTALIEKIRYLDALDKRDHGTKFKHFIFTDVREPAAGAKALAAFLVAAGFELRQGRVEKMVKRRGVLVKKKTGATKFLAAETVAGGCDGFALLQSAPLWKNPVSVETKKEILRAYNSRPDNVNGELLRLIVLDSKYKEGIDLFDVKYVHLLEPAIATSDLKQAVGRATRYCGQRGLHFIPRRGWPLQVYVYNTELPSRAPFVLGDGQKVSAHDLMLARSGLDLALLNLTKELTVLAIQTAVDYDLTYKINNFDIETALLEAEAHPLALQGGGEQAIVLRRRQSSPHHNLFPAPSPPKLMNASNLFANADKRAEAYEKLQVLKKLPFAEFQKEIGRLYAAYKWKSPVVKNGCESSAIVAPGRPVTFTQTQDFVRHYLTPDSPFKGLLAWHSVGTGKTCMAVAAATSEFEAAGYTILWVTRNALMADVYKNIFGSVCSIPLMEQLEAGAMLPTDLKKQKRMLSRSWTPPISYRMFQNALERKNALGRALYEKSPHDPLHKTILIMDEVHKLQDGDLSASESADFGKIRNYIWESYEASGKDSVRPLLMTATPITDTPRDLFELLNCLIGRESERLMDFDMFREKYTDAGGNIHEGGKHYFQERAKGLISYLNREYDPTTFAQPEFHSVPVPLGEALIPAVEDLVDKCLAGIEETFDDKETEDCDALEKEYAAELATLDSRTGLTLKEKRAATKTLKVEHKARVKDCKARAKEWMKTRKAALKKIVDTTKSCYVKQKKLFTAKNKVSQVGAMERCFGKPLKRKFTDRSEFLTSVKRRVTRRSSRQLTIPSMLAVRGPLDE